MGLGLAAVHVMEAEGASSESDGEVSDSEGSPRPTLPLTPASGGAKRLRGSAARAGAAENAEEEDDESGGRGKKVKLPDDAVRELKAWLLSPEHIDFPYPTDEVRLKRKRSARPPVWLHLNIHPFKTGCWAASEAAPGAGPPGHPRPLSFVYFSPGSRSGAAGAGPPRNMLAYWRRFSDVNFGTVTQLWRSCPFFLCLLPPASAGEACACREV